MELLWRCNGVIFVPVVAGLRLTEVVVPPVVDIHEDITLCCRFDTDGEKLYSVKWYKDDFEFYRFMPGNSPQTQIFPRTGIVLDVSEGQAFGIWRILVKNSQKELKHNQLRRVVSGV